MSRLSLEWRKVYRAYKQHGREYAAFIADEIVIHGCPF